MSVPDFIAGLIAVYRAFAFAADGYGHMGRVTRISRGRVCRVHGNSHTAYQIYASGSARHVWCADPLVSRNRGGLLPVMRTMCRAAQFVVNEPSEDLYVTFGLPALPPRFEFHPIILYSFVPSCVICNVLSSDTTIFWPL